MITVLQPHPLDGTGHAGVEDVARRGRHHVVVAARQQQDGAGDPARSGGGLVDPFEQRQARRRSACPGRRARPPPPWRCRSRPRERPRCPASRTPRITSRKLSAGGSMKGFTRARPRISGWCSASQQARVPPTDRATMATSSQPAAIFAVGRLGRRRPVGPAGGDHVLDGGAVTGQQGEVDGVAGGGQGLGQGPHGLRVAGEAVEHEDAARRHRCGRRARHRGGWGLSPGACYRRCSGAGTRPIG